MHRASVGVAASYDSQTPYSVSTESHSQADRKGVNQQANESLHLGSDSELGDEISQGEIQ
jgi:hypothetical protein